MIPGALGLFELQLEVAATTTLHDASKLQPTVPCLRDATAEFILGGGLWGSGPLNRDVFLNDSGIARARCFWKFLSGCLGLRGLG